MKTKNAFYFALFAIFFLAISLRLDLFLFNKSFWFDEAALAINVIEKDFSGLFGNLMFKQTAPCMFLFETKILVKLFNISEYVFRLIPFIASIFSIFLFYPYTRYFIKNKYARLFSCFLFAINTNLICYSTEFKPYALDVLATISLPYIVFLLKLKRPFLLGAFFSLFVWYSYASGLIEFALIVVIAANVARHREKLKNLFIFLAPQIINFIIFMFHFSAISKTREYMANLWSASYIENNLSNLVELYLNNIFYLFHPYKFIFKPFPYLLPVVIGAICIYGAIILWKKNKLKFWMLLSPYFVMLLAAYLNSYPYYDRLTIFLTPIFIILFVLPLEKIFKSRFGTIALAALILVSIHTTLVSQNVMKNLPAQDYAVFEILKEKIKPDDIIVVTPYSWPSLYYFSKRYDFDLNGRKIIKEDFQYSAGKYLNYLNSLESGKNYWFYVPSIKHVGAIDTKECIEFWGESLVKFKHYKKGEVDLYYARK